MSGGVDLLEVVALSLRVATASTLLILIPGVATAWLLSRRRWRGRAVLDTLVTLPLVLPPTAVGLLLLYLFSPDGPLGGPLDRWLGVRVVFTWWAATLAAGVVSFPLLVRGVRGALDEVDPRLVQMARTLGRNGWQSFRDIELPLAWRGIAAGALMAFSRALGEFGATILVAGNIPGRTQTLALGLFQRAQVGDDVGAWRLASVAVVLAVLALWVTELLVGYRERRLDDGRRESSG